MTVVFNQMSAHLRKERNSLEERVQERTAELEQINCQLRQEITERRQVEAALRESEARYRRLVENSSSIVYSFSDRRGGLFYSARVEEILGYSVLNLLEHPFLWRNSIHPDDLERTEQAIQAAANGTMIDIEYRMQDAQGNWRWFNDRFIGHSQHESETIIEGLALDITGCKQAEEELQRYARRLETLHQLDLAILSAQSPAEIAQAAECRLQQLIPCRWTSTIAYDPVSDQGKILAASIYGQLVPVDGTIVRPLVDLNLLRAGQIQVIENFTNLLHISPQHSTMYAQGLRSCTVVPLLMQGELLGWLNLGTAETGLLNSRDLEIGREVAASLAIALQQARLYEQVRQDAQTKTTLLREINHRVRNNMMAISGLVMAERRALAGLDYTKAEAALERLAQRVYGLAEAHQILSETSWSPLPLSRLAKRIVEKTLNACPTGRRVEVEVVEQSPVQVSARQADNLALVLNELTTNTIKYALPVLNGHHPAHISVTCSDLAGQIRLEYRDNEPGYPTSVINSATDSNSYQKYGQISHSPYRWFLCGGKPQGANYNALYPVGESRRDCFSNQVIGRIDIGVDEPPIRRLEQAAGDALAQVDGLLADSFQVQETAFASVAFLLVDDPDTGQHRFVGDQLNETGHRKLDEVLVVAAAQIDLLLPAVVFTDDQYANPFSHQPVYNASAGDVQVVGNAPVADAAQATDASRSVAVGRKLALQLGLALVIELVGGFERATINNKRLKALLICSYRRQSVHPRIKAGDPGRIERGVRSNFNQVNHLHHIIALAGHNPHLADVAVGGRDTNIEAGGDNQPFREGRAAESLVGVGQDAPARLFGLVAGNAGWPQKAGRVLPVGFAGFPKPLPGAGDQ